MRGGVSVTERDYLQRGVEADLRGDGRGRLDARASFLSLGVLAQASGSCRLAVHNGCTILVGVRVQVEETAGSGGDPTETTDIETDGEGSLGGGRIVCSVECSPSAAKQLSPGATAECSEFLTRILNGPQGGIDLKSLSIVPGALSWVISIEALIVEYGGNLLDTLLCAIRGALFSTRVPRVTEETSEGHYAFDVSEDETELLKGREEIPLSVTLTKIGHRYIIDAAPAEELCSDASLTVCVNPHGRICALKKSGGGGIEPSLLNAMLQAARPHGLEMLKKMRGAMEREETRVEGLGDQDLVLH